MSYSANRIRITTSYDARNPHIAIQTGSWTECRHVNSITGPYDAKECRITSLPYYVGIE